MEKILVFINERNHYNFFKKLSIPLKELGYEIYFITDFLSIYLEIKKEFPIYYVKKDIRIQIDFNISNSTTLKMELLNQKEAEVSYLSMYNNLEKINTNLKFKMFFMWNGNLCQEKAMKDFADKNIIKTLFFELGNITDRIFVDKDGANAQSNLYKHPEILEQLNIEGKVFEEWKKEYLANKLKTHLVPQAPKKAKHLFISKMKNNWVNLIDNIGFYFFKIPKGSDFLIIDRIKRKFSYKNNPVKINYDSVDFKNENYILFPLQVCKDSQLLINSEVDNIEAINMVHKMSKELGLKLFIKPHPAEWNEDFIKEIYSLKEKFNFYFVNYNTFELIKFSQKVVTINSTVGLESKILNKDVEFLGRSFYKHLDEKYLKNYILGYLIEADYFGNKPIAIESTKKIIERITL